MITLDPTLASAQDSPTRHPLVEVISSSRVPDIPFTGQFLTTETYNEFEPFTITLSTGALAAVYLYRNPSPATDYGIKYYYTDTLRQVFTAVTISFGNVPTFGVSCCELSNGTIGLTYFTNDGTNYRLKYRIITPSGTAVSDGEIAFWSNGVLTSHTWLQKIGSTYVMIYAKQSGANYYVYKRTSADFVTWSAESAITIPSFPTTHKLYFPSLALLPNGNVWLIFAAVDSVDATGTELSNIYYSISSDSGATFGAAVKLTNFTSYSTSGSHPMIVPQSTSNITIIYNKLMSVLRMNKTTTGWPATSATGDAVSDIHFDPVTRKLYVTDYYNDNVVKIDVDSWTVDKYWSTTTVPAFVGPTGNPAVQPGAGAGPYVPMLVNFYGFDCLNGDDNVIKHYYFENYSGFTKNVNISGFDGLHILDIEIDAVGRKAYVTVGKNWTGYWENHFILGTIDLTETISPTQLYSWTQILSSSVTNNGLQNVQVALDQDYYLVCRNQLLDIYILSSGTLWKTFTSAGSNGFPYNGLNDVWFFSGYIWGTFNYTTSNGQTDCRGLFRLEPITGAMSYHRPSFTSVDDYHITQLTQGEPGQLLVACQGYGLAVYDINSDTWQLFSNTNIPGMSLSSPNNIRCIAYDPLNKDVITADSVLGGTYIFGEIVLFSLFGILKQTSYFTGVYSGSSWTFADQGKMVTGLADYDAVGTPDPNDSTAMYVFWEDKNTSQRTGIKWSKNGSALDLSPFLMSDTDVAVTRSIDGTFNKLTFACSQGALFDPHNVTSLLSPILQKGRQIAVRWGEMVGGIPYWQAAGTFYVTKAKLAFERGKYTDIQITAEDMRTIWADRVIYATSYYDNFPEDIITDVVNTFGGVAPSTVALPLLANRVQLEHQWVDTPLGQILTDIAERFGYFIKIDVNNKITASQIGTGAVAHAYTDLHTIITYAPDDTFSDFTNRVTVIGADKDYIQVQYPEEKVGTIHGTVGWWGFKKDFEIDYSNDRTKTYINPRMQVLESATSIGFKLQNLDIFSGFSAGSITEKISFIDPNNKYCVVTVEAPDLTPTLVQALLATILALKLGDGVPGTGVTVRIGTLITDAALVAATTILASVGNFQFDIYAVPVGAIRRSLQSSADDLDYQKSLGVVVEKKLNNYLCYSSGDCQVVAAFELNVVKLQRKRVKIQKIAHLQDEEGDTISIRHPYTGLPLNLFITNLKRSYKKATGQNSNDGYFLDDIEGWVL